MSSTSPRSSPSQPPCNWRWTALRPSARSLNKRREAISVFVTTLMLARLELAGVPVFDVRTAIQHTTRELACGSCEFTPIGGIERILLQAEMPGERRLELAAHPGPSNPALGWSNQSLNSRPTFTKAKAQPSRDPRGRFPALQSPRRCCLRPDPARSICRANRGGISKSSPAAVFRRAA